MNGPLAALEAIDWTGVTDFYGPVDELPGLLRATLSQDDAERLEALKEAGNQLYHQSGVCEASVHVVPFLARAALSAPQDRWWFLSWIVDSCGPQQDAEQDDTGLVGRVKDAVLVELPALLGLLADPDPRLRRETLKLIAAFPYATTAGLVDITTLSDPDPSARADLITVVADLRQDWPGVIDYLDRALADEDVGVRYQAARLLMIFSGTPYPAHLLDTVADALAERGRFPNDSSSINRFCGVPGYTERSPRGVNGLRADPLVQDPDAAAYAARRILGSASPHADYAMLLAKEIEILWRGREREATALVLDALTAVSEPREQYLTLRCIVRMLAGTEDRDRDLLGRLEAWANDPSPTSPRRRGRRAPGSTGGQSSIACAAARTASPAYRRRRSASCARSAVPTPSASSWSCDADSRRCPSRRTPAMRRLCSPRYSASATAPSNSCRCFSSCLSATRRSTRCWTPSPLSGPRRSMPPDRSK